MDPEALLRMELEELRTAHAALEEAYAEAMEDQAKSQELQSRQRQQALSMAQASQLKASAAQRELAAEKASRKRREDDLLAEAQLLRLELTAAEEAAADMATGDTDRGTAEEKDDEMKLCEELKELQTRLYDAEHEFSIDKAELTKELMHEKEEFEAAMDLPKLLKERLEERFASKDAALREELRHSEEDCRNAKQECEAFKRLQQSSDGRTGQSSLEAAMAEMARMTSEMTAASLRMASGSPQPGRPGGEAVTDGLAEVLRTAAVTGEAPRIRAQNALSLAAELRKLKVYFNDAKIVDRRTWVRTVRSRSDGTAKTEVEYFIQHELGGEEAYQGLLLQADVAGWIRRWLQLEGRLKQAVGLTIDNERSEATARYRKTTLSRTADAAGVRKFLEEYRQARGFMLEHGLVDDSDAKSVAREVQDFLGKISGSDLHLWLLDWGSVPKRMDSFVLGDRDTVLGRCRQYVENRIDDEPRARGDESLLQLDAREPEQEEKEDQEDCQEEDEGPEEEQEEEEEDWNGVTEEEEAFNEENYMYGCHECWGWHPECGNGCPNTGAAEDSRFNVARAFERETECNFWYPLCPRPCRGVGHVVRHHLACLTPRSWVVNHRHQRAREAQRLDMGDEIHVAERAGNAADGGDGGAASEGSSEDSASDRDTWE